MRRNFLCAAGLAFFLNFHLLSASTLSDLKIIKISGADQTAVAKAGGRLRLLKPGDRLDAGVQVLEIGENRIVIEEHTSQGKEVVIIHLENREQKSERVGKSAAPNQKLFVPQSVPNQE